MADTRVQLEAEDWIRREWLPRQFNQQFRRVCWGFLSNCHPENHLEVIEDAG